MWISNKKFIVENMFCSAALEALETEKLSMLSGYKVEEWSGAVTEGNSYDPELVSPLPQGETGGSSLLGWTG